MSKLLWIILFIILLVIVVLIIPGKTVSYDISTSDEKPLQRALNASEGGYISRLRDYKIALGQFAVKYGGNYYELYKVVQCESSWRDDVYGDGGRAFGLAQFHKPTFEQYCEGDYCNAYDQLECMTIMIKDGLGRHWTCWKNLK